MLRYTNVRSLTVNGASVDPGTGEEVYNVESTASGTQITLREGDFGNSTINVSPTARQLSMIQGNLTLVSNFYYDRLVVFDQNNAASGTSYTVTNATVQSNLSASINYGYVYDIQLNGGAGTRVRFDVQSTSFYSVFTINEWGTGDDSVNITPGSAFLTNLQGPVVVNGNGAADGLNVHDENDPNIDAYEVTSSTVSREGSSVVVYHRMKSIAVYGGYAKEVFNVESTNLGTPVTIYEGGTADDIVNVSPAARFLDDIQGDITVNGNGGANSLNIVDSNDYFDDVYTVTASWVKRNSSAYIYYRNVKNLTLSAGTRTDECNLQSTASGCSTVVNAGGGDNSFRMLGGQYLGPLTLNGGGGTNTLDYSAYTTNVIVDLPLGFATDVVGGICNIQNVIGGNDGPSGSYNVLVGNGGNVLIGGSGRRNLLIAGASASTLYGGNDDDILIGGTTIYDTDLAALRAIIAEWTRTDEDFTTRVYNLSNGIGVPLVDSTSVWGNGGGNTMIGNGELALIFTDGLDTIPGVDPGSVVIPIGDCHT